MISRPCHSPLINSQAGLWLREKWRNQSRQRKGCSGSNLGGLISALFKVLSFLGESRGCVCPSFGTFIATILARTQGGFYAALLKVEKTKLDAGLQKGCCAG